MKRQINLENLRFVAGAATLGFGACLLYGNLAELIAVVNGALHGGSEAPRLFAVLFAISQFFWVHAANHPHALEYLLRHGALAAAPILLMATGTTLLRDEPDGDLQGIADKQPETGELKKNYVGLVDLTASRSTLK